MKLKLILNTLLVFLLFISISANMASSDANDDLIAELSDIDVFHPPNVANHYRADLYNEWHYFNMFDEEQDISIVTTLKLNGNVSNPSTFPMTSSAQVLLGYDIGGIPTTVAGIYSPTYQADYSNLTPDVRMGLSTVNLTAEGYRVHIETDNGNAVFDALFKPCAEPFFMQTTSIPEMIDMNWLVASPSMMVNGTLTINDSNSGPIVYTFENAKGYHDHNWGYWNWGNLQWDWGQFSQNCAVENNANVYTVSFGNVTSTNGVQLGQDLNVWKNNTIVASFSEISVIPISSDEIDSSFLLQYLSPEVPIELPPSVNYPNLTVVQAISDDSENIITITFETEQAIPLPIPTLDNTGEPTVLIIWELLGTYSVEGVIDGVPLSYTEKGFMEDAGPIKALSNEEPGIPVTDIPEYPTIALPMVAVIGLASLFMRRKE